MAAVPRIVYRQALHYVAVAATTSIEGEAGVIARHVETLEAWRASHGGTDAGHFVRYRRIEMPHRLEIEVCLPSDAVPAVHDGLVADGMPPGRYAVLAYEGPVEGLVDANRALQDWAGRHAVVFDMHADGAASVWTARIERYRSAPDAATRRVSVEIAYRLADA